MLTAAMLALALPAGAGAQAAPYLDWASLLPPLPVANTPATVPDCADGSTACIDATIAEMQRRLDTVVPVCDHRVVFSLAYLRVTEDVRDAINSGVFKDRRWLAAEDAYFARLYFEAYDAYAGGRRADVPRPWRIAFDAAVHRKVSALGDFLLAMNAHINRDMPFVLAALGLRTPSGASRKPDHDVYNRRLAALYAPVLKEVADRFDPSADDVELGIVDDEFAYGVLMSWREMVWRNAERLVRARTPAAKRRVARSIEAYATGVGTMLRTTFASGPAKRDAWCATHGGQHPG